jgi:hypothetical protein
MPCLAMAARISSRVKSGCLAIRAKIQSECCSNGETLPPLRFGAALPVSLQRWHHRITELTPTLKISAISRRDAPLSTASTARSRKSMEYGLGIELAPQANQFPQIRPGDSGWESLRFNTDGKCSRANMPGWSRVCRLRKKAATHREPSSDGIGPRPGRFRRRPSNPHLKRRWRR